MKNNFAQSVFPPSVVKSIREIQKIKERSHLDKIIKLWEEFGELCEVFLCVKESPGSEYKRKRISDLVEETVDVMLCVLSIYMVNTTLDHIKASFTSLKSRELELDTRAKLFQIKTMLDLFIKIPDYHHFKLTIRNLLIFIYDYQSKEEEIQKIFTTKLEKWNSNIN